MPRKARATPAKAGKSGNVRLLTPSDGFDLSSELVDHLSIYWSYLVRTRTRWSSDAATAKAIAEEAKGKLAELGIPAEILQKLATADFVQVTIPFEKESVGWAPRILPWEFLLATATREYRTKPLTVVRHLEVPGRKPRDGTPARLLFVQSAPGPLREFFTFDAERKIVESGLAIQALPPCINPSKASLEERLKELPDVVHVTGVDVHQGTSLMGGKDPETLWDGVFLADSAGLPAPVYAEEFGGIFRRCQPELVACNFYHSAARVAAMCVALGANASIGFQDELDDRLAEQFYGTFYEKWRAHDWDLLAAFRETLSTVAVDDWAGGIVLWTAESLVQAERKPMSASYAAERESHRTRTVGSGTGTGHARDWFAVNVRAPKQINYSVLHNRESLFEIFSICKLQAGYVTGIRVEVELYAGGERFPYRASIAMSAEETFVDLTPRIHVPLLSNLFRANRENVNTCLYVSVSYAGQELFCDTFPVTLLAVDEWKFDPNDDSRWLASFVLPRDPAVLKIINTAQHYVSALRDDVGAGFDGYQSVDVEADDPELGVELQVRAIWSALVNDLPLNYINPPPTFTENAQRLRTPSDVLNNGRGTCIDLALLLASCLEYVEIYPVVFVLKDHAFPGYWRSEESYNRWFNGRAAQNAVLEAAARGGQFLTPYDETMQLVNSGDLVPLETVWLTQKRSFREAIDAGVENLIDRQNFGALLDVRSARAENVTPLPLLAGSL